MTHLPSNLRVRAWTPKLRPAPTPETEQTKPKTSQTPTIKAGQGAAPATAETVAAGLLLWQTNLTDDQQRLIRTTAKGWAANTRRAFLSAVQIWEEWCTRRSVPVHGATGQHMARFVRELARLEYPQSPNDWFPAQRRIASIEAYLVHLKTAYSLLGHTSPTSDPQVRADLKVIRKQQGSRQRQAVPLRYKGEVSELSDPAIGISIANLLKGCGKDWTGLRDAALLQVAYDTACRRSELVAMRIEHLTFDPDGSGSIEIPRAKTDQSGEGTYRYLSPASCTALQVWIARGKLGGFGPIFRPIKTDFTGEPISIPGRALHPNSITLILKAIVLRAQAHGHLSLTDGEVKDWLRSASSHSFRVGKLQEHIAAGDDIGPIAQAYAIKDARTVMRYGARLRAKSGAAARLAEKMLGSG
jgi:integrase